MMHYAPHRIRAKNWLLIDDSHAADFWRGLQVAIPNVHVMQATAAACRMSVTPLPKMRSACTELMQHIFFDLVPKDRPERIILSARWHPDDFAPLAAILQYLHKLGIPVLILGPNPEYIRDLPLVLADSIARRSPRLVEQSLVQNLPEVDAALRKLAVSHGAGYSSIFEALCNSGRCVTLVNGVPVLFDTHHFTIEGAALLVNRLRAAGYLSDAH